MDDPLATDLVLQRHEVPTVFVRGTVVPDDVQHVEDMLSAALFAAPDVHYSVLTIEASPDLVRVGVEAGVGADVVDEIGTGTTVRAAGEACMAAVRRRVEPVPLANGA
jgi:hypothetical protein